jgi:hypothetical protein
MALLGTSACVADMAILGTSDIVADMALLGTSDCVADMALLGTSDCVADMALLGTSDCVADMALLGTSDCIADMALLGTSDCVADMALLGTADCVADMNTLATSDIVADLNTLATSDIVSDLETVADNIAGVNSFADRYRVASSAPASSLDEGDLYFNTTTNTVQVYNGSAWENVAVSAATVVSKTSATGSAALPSGTTVQRDGSPSAGYLRWNTTDTSAEVYDGSDWAAVGGGNTTDMGLYEHAHTISADYSITSGNNALTAGPITIDGCSVTVPSGSTWVIA